MDGTKRLPAIPTSLDMDITAEHEQEGVGKEKGRKDGGVREGEKIDQRLHMLGHGYA